MSLYLKSLDLEDRYKLHGATAGHKTKTGSRTRSTENRVHVEKQETVAISSISKYNTTKAARTYVFQVKHDQSLEGSISSRL